MLYTLVRDNNYPMDNDVKLNEQDIIEIALPYKISLDDFSTKFQKLFYQIHKLRTDRKKVLILLDYTGNLEPQSFNVTLAEQGAGDLDFDKIATIGANEILRGTTEDVLSSVYKGRNLKHFENREEAVAWLLND